MLLILNLSKEHMNVLCTIIIFITFCKFNIHQKSLMPKVTVRNKIFSVGHK